MSNRQKHVVIIICWIIFTACAFAYFINSRLNEFDPNETLSTLTANELAQQLSALSSTKNLLNENTIVHFTNQDCHCNSVTQTHIDKLNTFAQEQRFAIKTIEVSLGQTIIPSTPSVAIIDSNQQLIYFGPYGQGLNCGDTAGFAKTVLTNFIKGYLVSAVIDKAKGCYCSN